MGQTPLGPAGDFAAALADVIYDLMIGEGGDPSSRWIASRTSRSKDYWRDVFAHKKPMNANDIAEVSEIFETDPFSLSRDADARMRGNVTSIQSNVSRDLQTMHLDEERHAAETKSTHPDEDLRTP